MLDRLQHGCCSRAYMDVLAACLAAETRSRAILQMPNNLRQTLINELSELSLSLSDGLERISEFGSDDESDPDNQIPAPSEEGLSQQSNNQNP